MTRILTSIIVLAFAFSTLAQEKLATWQRGSVNDVKLQKDHPTVITTAKDFETLYKKWNPDGKLPEVDFEKNLILVATTNGSNVGGKPTLVNGDLRFVPFATLDLGEGFRYLFVLFPKDGVKTVNGNALPK
jgi:hypothetical protein